MNHNFLSPNPNPPFTSQSVRLPQGNRSINSLSKLTGHTYNVTSAAFSPKDKHLASGSYDRTVKLWDIDEGTVIATLTGHRGVVSSVAFSSDGELLASGSWDKVVIIWSVASRQLALTLQGHAAAVESIAFSPDGTRVASGSDDKTIKLWNARSGVCITTFEGHLAPVKSVAFSPNRNVLASGSSDQSIRLWNIASGTTTAILKNHTKTVNSIAFSPDGKHLASGSDDTTIAIWNTEKGEHISTLNGHSGAVYCLAFSPKGDLLLSGSGDKSVRIWDVNSGEYTSLTGHVYWVLTVAFSSDGSQFASGSADKTIQRWAVVPDGVRGDMRGNLNVPGITPGAHFSGPAPLSGLTSVDYSTGLEDRIAQISLSNDISGSVKMVGNDRIGSGGFGDVFLGEHVTHGKVALKRPRLLLDLDGDALRRFTREVDIWREIAHRYVLPCYGMCKLGREIYVVSPYIQNGDLYLCLKQGKVSNRRKILYEISEALAHIHGRGIVHGDIKAQNVLISDEGSAFLTDFGLAKIFDKMATSLSFKGAGSFRWMAPELFHDDGSRSFKSDVYSFGITIAEVLSQQVPYPNIRDERALFDFVTANGRPPKEPSYDHQGNSYELLWNVADKCWAPNPDDRPTMAEVCGFLASQV